MIRGIDTAATVSESAARKLKALGYEFVGRYIVPNEGNTAWKALTAPEAKILRSAGLSILLCWETTASRAKQGALAGATDGNKALCRALELGVPDDAAIFFAVDYDAPKKDYASIEAYLRGAKWNIGNHKLGVYAPPVLINQMKSIIDYGWRTYAWNYGVKVDTDVYQTVYQDDPKAKALAVQVGFNVDLDEAMSLESMWKPKSEEEYALEWAKDITDDPKLALALWRYHKLYG